MPHLITKGYSGIPYISMGHNFKTHLTDFPPISSGRTVRLPPNDLTLFHGFSQHGLPQTSIPMSCSLCPKAMAITIKSTHYIQTFLWKDIHSLNFPLASLCNVVSCITCNATTMTRASQTYNIVTTCSNRIKAS